MKKTIVAILLLLLATICFAQGVELRVKNERLDKVLLGLKVQISFDSRALSKYKVSVERTFLSPNEAINYLLSDKPFICEEIGGVFVISSKPEPKKTPKPIKEEVKGGATTLPSEEIPSINANISEITITAAMPTYSPIISDESTSTFITEQRVARLMPGSGDNSVFNLLRLMPGIRASGEPSDELIVWGSTAGESRIVFDGIPLFGMRGFNDNISFINPYLVKDIKVLKGGYGASYGNQIGAVAEISGNAPNVIRPSVKANISTLTANVYGSLPISKRSALSIAYRRTFYDLYDNQVFNPFNGRRPIKVSKSVRPRPTTQTAYITPKYLFSDLNLSYSGTLFDRDEYRISLYGAKDKFSYTADYESDETIEGMQESRQYGASASYKRFWNEGSVSKLSLSFSRLNTFDEETNRQTMDFYAEQYSATLSHSQVIGKFQRLEAGFQMDRFSVVGGMLLKPSLFLSDKISIGLFSFNAGLRGDFLPSKINLQPRLSATVSLSKGFNIFTSWGLYNQYMTRLPYNIKDKQYMLIWGINDQLKATHTVLGLSYKSPVGFSATLEGFSKNISGAVRLSEEGISSEDISLLGGDLFLKYDFKRGSLFGSYSLINSKDDGIGHELKFGSLINLKPFILSANYIYGTGFTLLNYSGGEGKGNAFGRPSNATLTNIDKPYSRFDIAATYRLYLKGFTLQTGVSLINLFNTENLKYSYTIQGKNDPITLYSGAMPFTPMFFLEILW